MARLILPCKTSTLSKNCILGLISSTSRVITQSLFLFIENYLLVFFNFPYMHVYSVFFHKFFLSCHRMCLIGKSVCFCCLLEVELELHSAFILLALLFFIGVWTVLALLTLWWCNVAIFVLLKKILFLSCRFPVWFFAVPDSCPC